MKKVKINGMPFKRWMAQIANERLDEPENSELTIDCALWEYK